MRKSRSIAFAGITALSFVTWIAVPAPPAQAQVPSASNSSCPAMVTVGPTRAGTFDVVVRDVANNPVAGATVTVDLGGCGASFCPTQPPGLTIVAGTQARVFSDGSGLARFSICGSLPAPCTAHISADGVLLANVPAHNTVQPQTVRTSMTFGGTINAQPVSYAATASLVVATGHFDAVASSIAESPVKKCRHHITTKHG